MYCSPFRMTAPERKKKNRTRRNQARQKNGQNPNRLKKREQQRRTPPNRQRQWLIISILSCFVVSESSVAKTTTLTALTRNVCVSNCTPGIDDTRVYYKAAVTTAVHLYLYIADMHARLARILPHGANRNDRW